MFCLSFIILFWIHTSYLKVKKSNKRLYKSLALHVLPEIMSVLRLHQPTNQPTENLTKDGVLREAQYVNPYLLNLSRFRNA